MTKKTVRSLDQKAQEFAITDKQVDRAEFKKYLVNDMRTCVVFMSEVLSIPEAVEALTDVYYKRYTDLMVKKNQVPDPEDVPESLKEEEVDPSQTKMFS